MLLWARPGGAALAFLYKIWRILQSDRKVDDLDNAERSFREEMRTEIKELKEDRHKLTEEREKLYEHIHTLQVQISEFRSSIAVCALRHPDICPLLNTVPRPRILENRNDTTN